MGLFVTDIRIVRASDASEVVAICDDDTAPKRWRDPFGGLFSEDDLRALDDVATGSRDSITFDRGTRFERTLHLRVVVDLRRPR